MNESAARSTASETMDLEFPVAPAYAPRPASISLEEAARLIEQLRAWFPDALETEQERLARKVDMEFVL